MNRNKQHSKSPKDPDGTSRKLLAGADIPWEKSSEEVWKDLSVRLEEKDNKQKIVQRYFPGKQGLAMAASVALLLAVTFFSRFYTVEKNCKAGERVSVAFSDGSEIELNSQSSIQYHPLWWFVHRKVRLEGEAFFKVREGRRFSVVSSLATTEVLGTTFNVYAREKQYKVACHSGMVRITSEQTNEYITISVNEKASLNAEGGFDRARIKDLSPLPEWMRKMITFTSAPIRLVFDEIERQYGIVIEATEPSDLYFSGKFSLEEPVENILSIVCRPFELEYEHIAGNKYKIYPVRMEH